MKITRSILLIAFLMLFYRAFGQPAERLIRIQITPNHTDWLYKPGEKIKFSITVLKNNVPIPDTEIRYEISEDMMKPHKEGILQAEKGTATVEAKTMEKPGFLRCQAFVKYGGREYQGIVTVGINPEKLKPITSLPEDFLNFWETAKLQAQKTPMDVQMTLVPERCTEKVNVFHVNIQNYESHTRLYGMLAMPKAKGRYPAVLKLPGAGIRSYAGDVEHAANGWIVFEIGIHGIPVNMSGPVYTNLYMGALKGYHTFNLDNRDKYYYKRVYLGCVRAIDFIYSLPQFDGSNLITFGSSQGGGLSIVTAGLDSRVKGLVAFYPALCDMVGYIHNRAGGWPHMFNKQENQTAEKANTARYYDAVNFARQIKVPGFYSFGYNDMVCPPTTTYSAYNVIQAPKQILVSEETAHYAYPEQWAAAWKWVADFFQQKKIKTIRIMRILFFITTLLFIIPNMFGQKEYRLNSPDGKLEVTLYIGDRITYELTEEGHTLVAPSPLSVHLDNGTVWGNGSHLKRVSHRQANEVIPSPFYKRSEVKDVYNEMTLSFREHFNLIFRMYNEGMAYRFAATGNRPFKVTNEEAAFNFNKDYKSIVPYVKDGDKQPIEAQFSNSFENTYTHIELSGLNPQRLMFTPVVIEQENGRKLCIAESDVESYPGMFLINRNGGTALTSAFAAVPKTKKQGGHNQLQILVTERENYIASCQPKAKLPWRIIVVARNDKELADNDMVYKLAAPSRMKDISWIRPGKVAWEWWNHWGIKGVDFEAGINNETYMHYIDFASRHGIEYVILDEGWAVNLEADLFQIVPEIDLKKLTAYARQKNVGLILWAGYHAFARDMEHVCKHYSEMGIKGFKIDFMDRDDQEMVDFHYRAAETAAKYKLMVDFHGTYKPTGLNRTYPNVINYEAVHGLEQMKWSDIHTDQVTYDVTMPFIRMLAGPVDYTQGAMHNANKRCYHSSMDTPMSQGTRCRQLAEYVVFESPLNMLCDSPTNYDREEECTEFIATIPTVWEQTIAMNGEIGKCITMARRKGDVWYVGSLTNWDARTLTLDLSFLGAGRWKAEMFHDGVNANRLASDYQKTVTDIPASRKLTVKMAQGGGCALKIYKE